MFSGPVIGLSSFYLGARACVVRKIGVNSLEIGHKS